MEYNLNVHTHKKIIYYIALFNNYILNKEIVPNSIYFGLAFFLPCKVKCIIHYLSSVYDWDDL